MQILILGMHRSGTSMLTRLVNMMGAYFGPESLATAANNENPKGFWERRDIRKLNDALLLSADADWHRIADYDPMRLPHDTMTQFEKGARAVILGMDAHRPWVMKEPRLCINLPIWLPLLECPVCLISVRDPIEAARSVLERNGIPIAVGIALAQTYYRRVLRATDHLPRAIVSHRALISNPTGEVRRIHRLLAEFGVKQLHIPSDTAVEEFIDPHLYRQQGSNELTRTYLTAAQSDFFAALGAADWHSLARMLEETAPELEILRLFEANEDWIGRDMRVKALARERGRLTSANAILNRQRSELQERNQMLRREKKALEQQLRAATLASGSFRGKLAELEASRSWRIGHGLVLAGARLLGKGAGASAFEELRLNLEPLSRTLIQSQTSSSMAAPLTKTRPAPISPSNEVTKRRDPSIAAEAQRLTARSNVATKTQATSAPALPAYETKRHALTVAVIAWDTGHNALGRAYLLAEALTRRFNVLLIGPGFERYGHDVWQPLRNASVATIRLPGGKLPDFARALESLAPKIEADVIVACKLRIPSLQLGLSMKAFCNRPLILDIDDFELSFFEDRAALSLAGLWSYVNCRDIELPFSQPWTRYSESLVQFADALLVSNVALHERFGGIIVPHARDESLFDPSLYDRAAARARYGYGSDDRVILFVGTPRRHKGLLEVARELAACPDARFKFCVIGSFTDRELERELCDLVGERLRLVPNRPFAELPQNLMIADVVCLVQDPTSEVSKYQLPAKVVDALAMGVPVLATATPPLRPLIEAGVVTAVTPQTLAERLQETLEESERLRRNQLERRAIFLRDFSYSAITETLERKILDLLDRGVPPLPAGALAFRDLQLSLGRNPGRAECGTEPSAGGIDVVVFWKQNDSGIYGRRVDMLSKYLSLHPRVRRVVVIDRPISLQAAMAKQHSHCLTHERRIFTEIWRKRWGLRDGNGVSWTLFLYSNASSNPKRRTWQWPAEDGYIPFLRDYFSQHRIDPARAVFLVYPENDAIPTLVDAFRPRLVVADIVDDHRTWPGLTPTKVEALTTHYRDVVALSDLVVANCESVQKSMRSLGKEVSLISNACETEPPAPLGDAPEAQEFRALAGPKVGYVGNLEAKIDIDLLDFLAQERPHWQIVLIGSTHANPAVRELDRHPNVHFFGVVPYPEVRAWIAEFDVAILPHLDTPQTRSMNPLKLYVYASVGVPVVATRVQNLGDLQEMVQIADCYQDFLKATEEAIAGSRPAPTAAITHLLAEHSWPARANELMGLLEPLLLRSSPTLAGQAEQ